MSHTTIEKTVTDPATGESVTTSDLPEPTTAQTFLDQVIFILGPESRKVQGSVTMIGEAIVCKDLVFFSPRGKVTVTANARNRPVFFNEDGVKVGPYDAEPSDMSVNSRVLFNRSTLPLKIRGHLANFARLTAVTTTGEFFVFLVIFVIATAVMAIPSALLATVLPVSWWAILASLTTGLFVTSRIALHSESRAFFRAMVTDLHRMGASYVRDFNSVLVVPESSARSVGNDSARGGTMSKDEMAELGGKAAATAIVSRNGGLQRVYVLKSHYEFFYIN